MWILRLFMVLAASGSTLASAQLPPGPPPRPPVDAAAALGLDPDRAAKVREILRASHERRREAMQSIGEETDRQLATILTPEELTRFRQLLPPPPRGPGGPPPPR